MFEKIFKKQEKVQKKVQKQQELDDKDCELTDEELDQIVGGKEQWNSAMPNDAAAETVQLVPAVPGTIMQEPVK